MIDEPRSRWRWVAAVGALVAMRAAHLAQSTTLPFLRGPIFDSEVYLAQARSLVGGHVGDATLLAFSPLYGVMLALCGGGRGWLLPVIAQLLLGVATVALLFVVARRAAGDRGAWLSAVLLAGYGVPLFYETKIMSETLGLGLALAGYALFLSSEREVGGVRRAAAAGVVLALAILARASLLFAGPLFVVAALLPWRRAGLALPARATRAAALAGGMALVLGAHGLVNLVAAGRFVPVIMVSRTAAVATRSGGAGDFRVYAREAGGDVSAWDVVTQAERRLRGEVPPETGGPLFGVDAGGWLRGLPTKVARTFSDTERSFDYGYYGERGELGVLGALPFSFGLFALLGLLGAVALVRREGAWSLVPHAPLLLGTLATTTIFYATTRYRLPMVLPLLVLAAHLVPAPEELAAARPRLVAAALAVLVFSSLTWMRRLERPAAWQLRVAEAAAVAGDGAEVARRIERARALAPDDADTEHRIAYVRARAAHPAPLPAWP